MTVKIMLAIPSLNRLDRLTTMLTSVVHSTRQPDRVLLINNGHQITDGLRADWSRQFDLDVYTPHANLGVARSVNFAWYNTPADWHWVHANDDIELEPHCLERMADVAEISPYAFIVPESGEGSAFTLCALHGSSRNITGYFDEQFSPAYYEDIDLGRRMNLIGFPRVIVPGAYYTHHTSSTLKAYTEAQQRAHHDQFRANCDRYIAKWGGEAEKGERFTVPYDGARGHTLANAHLWHKEWI